jgi:hypothetical protein
MRQPRGWARLPDAIRRSIEGSMNAAVLPVPVWAMPSRSRPSSSDGIDCAWIGVGRLDRLDSYSGRTERVGYDSLNFNRSAAPRARR